MKSVRRSALALALAAAAFSAAPARPDGTIASSGATLEIGTGTPAGAVTLDPSAGPKSPPAVPTVPSPGALGAMTGAIPVYPGGGGGSAFTAAADATIAGGTYNFTSYTVNQGVIVTYSGAVTIRTTGDVTINGQILTTAAGASVTILCGGNLSVPANQYGALEGVRVTGNGSAVTLDVQGNVSASSPDASRSAIRAFSGNVSVTSHSAGTILSLTQMDLRSPTGVTVRSSGPVALTGAAVDVDDGTMLVQAFGGTVTVSNSSLLSFGGELVVEGSRGVRVTNGSDVHAEGTLSLKGFGDPAVANGAEDVVIDDAGLSDFSTAPKYLRFAGPGQHLSVLSTAGVRFVNSPVVTHEGIGDIVVTAFGGSVSFETAGSLQETDVWHDGTGSIVVTAATGAQVAGSTQLAASNGSVSVETVSGALVLTGDPLLSADHGTLHLCGGTSLASGSHPGTGPDAPRLVGDEVSVGAGAGGLDASVADCSADTGTATIVAAGTARLRGPWGATGVLTVQSISGNVDVAGATLTTAASPDQPTAGVALESFGGTTAVDVSNAIVRTGASGTGRSGDIRVAVHSVPGPVVNAYLLPSKVTLKLNPRDAALSSLTASGTFDAGLDATDLSGDATLEVGGVKTTVTLVADPKGNYRHKDESIDLRLAPGKSGASRGTFSLKKVGDLTGLVDSEGAGILTVRLTHPAFDAVGTVTLAKGRFALGRARGTLVEPSFFVAKARGTSVGAGFDSLKLVTGFATSGVTPAAAPNLRIAFGGTFEIVVPSAAFGTAVKDRFTALAPAPGIASVVLDYAKETISVTGSGLDLGTFAPGPAMPVTVGVSLGTDNRSVMLRMRRAATKIAY